MCPTIVLLPAMSRVVAPRLCATRAFWLKSQSPLMTTTALPFNASGLATSLLSHSKVEVKFTKGYCNWKSKRQEVIEQD